MKLPPDEARRRFMTARVAHLATADSDGRPHLVPFTFTVDGDQVLHAVDAKPKSSRSLKRLRNIEQNPTVTALVDHYDDDWTRLWWIRADGHAEVTSDPAALDTATHLLAVKYPQYRSHPPAGPLVIMTVTRWVGWSASAPES